MSRLQPPNRRVSDRFERIVNEMFQRFDDDYRAQWPGIASTCRWEADRYGAGMGMSFTEWRLGMKESLAPKIVASGSKRRRKRYISNLPPEILGRIFVECHTIWQVSQASYCWNPRRTPMYLSSVCKYWRQVALATSELWTTCWLFYTHPEMNDIWLSRARSRTLTIEGWHDTLRRLRRPVQARKVLISLIPYAPSFKSFNIDFECIADHASADDIRMDVPNLVSCNFKGPAFPASRWLKNMFQYSPRLCEMEVHTFGEDVDFALPRLMQLKVDSVPHIRRLLVILSTATALQTFHVQTIKNPWRGNFNTPIVHSSLAHLHIRFRESKEIRLVFDTLSFPNLKTLAMETRLPPKDEDLISLVQFLYRSQCSLKTLQVRIPPFLGSFIAILEHPALSSLTSLEYSWMRIDDETIRFLGDMSHFPRLRKLVLDQVMPDNLNFSLVRNMVEARRVPFDRRAESGRRRLQYFEFTLDDERDHATREYYSEIRRIKRIAQASKREVDPLVVGPK